MRVILTEQQLVLIKENTDNTDRMNETIKDVKDGCNKMYNVLSFTTMAEFRDNDTDINVMKQKYDVLSNTKNTLDTKVNELKQANVNQDGEWDKPELEKIWSNLDIRLHNLSLKLGALGKLVEHMVMASEEDLHKPFNDINPKKM